MAKAEEDPDKKSKAKLSVFSSNLSPSLWSQEECLQGSKVELS